MTQCWSEGELRAYLDRELPPGDMERVAEHLKECPSCGELYAAMESCATRISMLLGVLPEPGPVLQMPRLQKGPRARKRWVIAAVAAALAIVFFAQPKRTAVVVVAPPQARPAPQPPAPTVKPAIIRKVVPVKPRPQLEYYVKLDDEPIETGIVVRVGLDDGQVPADVIVGPDGRARAIRLVSDLSGER